MFEQGKLTQEQMEELIVRQLKQEKIFGFSTYDEFFNSYFDRDLVAIENLNRIINLIIMNSLNDSLDECKKINFNTKSLQSYEKYLQRLKTFEVYMSKF